MKRKITIILLLIFVAVLMAVPASAVGSASLTTSDSTPYRGDTFTITVKLSGVGAWSAGAVEVSYGSGLEWVSARSEINGVSVNYELDKGRIIFYSMSDVSADGRLLSLTFKVKSGASFSANKINVTVQVNGEKLTASKSITVTCNHKYGTWNEASGGKHSRKCSICGSVDTQAHIYDNPCDTTCNSCPATRITSHSFSEDWTSDETGHWHLCVHCGEKSEVEAHEAGAAAGEYTDQVCTVCNFVLTPAIGHQHSYDDTYKTDGYFHWKKCLGCGEETEKVSHVFNGDCDGACDACDYQRRVSHSTGEQWSCNAEGHWKTCTNCSQRLEEGAHIWDSGTVTLEPTITAGGKMLHRCVLCHTERTEEIPTLPITDMLPWWGWLAAGAAGGVLLVLIIGGIVIGIKSACSPKGKYSA